MKALRPVVPVAKLPFASTVTSVPSVGDPLLPLAVARLACPPVAPAIAVSPSGPVPTDNAVAAATVAQAVVFKLFRN